MPTCGVTKAKVLIWHSTPPFLPIKNGGSLKWAGNEINIKLFQWKHRLWCSTKEHVISCMINIIYALLSNNFTARDFMTSIFNAHICAYKLWTEFPVQFLQCSIICTPLINYCCSVTEPGVPYTVTVRASTPIGKGEPVSIAVFAVQQGDIMQRPAHKRLFVVQKKSYNPIFPWYDIYVYKVYFDWCSSILCN